MPFGKTALVDKLGRNGLWGSVLLYLLFHINWFPSPTWTQEAQVHHERVVENIAVPLKPDACRVIGCGEGRRTQIHNWAPELGDGVSSGNSALE